MRRFLVPIGVVALLLVGALKVADWTCESWWFDSLGQRETFIAMMSWRAGAFAAFSLLWLLVLGQHMRLTWLHVGQWRERLALLGPLQAQPDSFDLSLLWATRITIAGGALIAGIAAANRFDVWMLAYYGRPAGGITPPADWDLAFYLFTLPAIAWAWNWFGMALVFTSCLVVFVYLATEVIETGPRYVHVTRNVANHLAFLCGLVVVWVGLKLGLNVLAAPIVDGGSLFGIHGPFQVRFGDSARQLFAFSSVFIAAAIWWLTRNERGKAAFFTFTIWLGAAFVVPVLAPSLAQSLGVDLKAEEEQAVLAHLQSTREAWGLQDAQLGQITIAPTALKSQAARNLNASEAENFNQALWPPQAMRDALRNGRLAPLKERRYLVQQIHLSTNAKGQVVYRAIQQDLLASQVGPATVIEASAGQIGFPQIGSPQKIDDVLLQESPSNDLTVAGALPTLDLGSPALPQPSWRETISGDKAIARDSFWNCLNLAAKYSRPGLLRPGPPISWHLTPRSRVGTLMPFIDWNQSLPRPVIEAKSGQSRLYYLMDGIVSSDSYPNSYSLGNDWNGVNYLRQNIVALVNASSGETKFYVLDPKEPITRVWQAIFPRLFEPISKLPADFREQIRPSDGVLKATGFVAERYHPVKGQNELERWMESTDSTKSTDDWKSLWADEPVSTPWRSIQASVNGKTRPALGCVYKPKNSENSINAIALVFDQGEDFIARQGRPQWHFYQGNPQKPLEFPADFLSRGRVTQTTFWPRLEKKNIAGLTLISSQANFGEDTADVTQPIKNREWSLESKLCSTESSIYGLMNNHESETVLQTLRSLWDNLKKARREGNWDEVGRLENSIGQTLALPTGKAKRTQ